MSASGVLKVYRKNKSYWVYSYHMQGKLRSLSDKSLLKLEKRVKQLNLDWIVKDDEVYEENITRDLEEFDDFCVFDGCY